MNEPRLRVLSVQTPLLGNATYGAMLRRFMAASPTIDFHAVWADAERQRHARRAADRLIYRLCFAHSGWTGIRARNADFFAMRYELGASYWANRLLARELRTFAPEVLHLHTQSVALASAWAMRRIPSVITCDMTSRLTADQFTRPGWRWTHAPQHAIEGRALRRAAAIVPFSRYVAASLIERYRVDPAKVTVIPPGVDLAAFDDVGVGRAARPDGDKRILFIGGEFERKGGHVLLEAFLGTFGERADVKLHLVTSQAARIPHHPRIVVHRDIVPYSPPWQRLYDDATVLVLPSLREAYGHVYLEAAAARLPVIGSRVGAAAELVDHGVTGLLLTPGDPRALSGALRTITDDRDAALRFGTAGRARVERDFDAARNALRLEAVFAGAAARRSHARRTR